MTPLVSGGFLATWVSDGFMMAQRYDGNGFPEQTPFVLGVSGWHPSLVALPSGGFIATWEDLLRNDNGAITSWLGTANGGWFDNYAAAATGAPTSWHIQPDPLWF